MGGAITLPYLFRPCVKFHNTITMESVTVQNATALDANEVLVVYRYDNNKKTVSRRIQHGPSVYMPAADEWCVIAWGWVRVVHPATVSHTSNVT